MTPGTGKFFPANNYHMHLFNGSYECMENGNIKEPMADDIVTRLRDVVCWCNEFDGVCDACQAADEIERLQRWKVEACSVLADWDAIYVSLGDRGELGQRKSAVVAAEIERLREIAEAAAQYHDVACNPDWCRLCRAISAWKEARRG